MATEVAVRPRETLSVELNGINVDLASVKANIGTMVKKINVVKARYDAQVLQLQGLDASLDRITVEENVMTLNLRARKELLGERLRQAYDTDRTSMVETFLSGESFTDVLSQVSYTIDVSEQDKALAEQIVQDQEALVVKNGQGLLVRTPILNAIEIIDPR